jgi:hypothetical protein
MEGMKVSDAAVDNVSSTRGQEMMVIRTHRSASKVSPLELQQMIQEAPEALVDYLTVMTTTKKVVLLRMNRMGGSLASARAVTFRGHTHMIGYQVRQPVHTMSH